MIFGIKSSDQAVTNAWRKTLNDRIKVDSPNAEQLETITILNMSTLWMNSPDKKMKCALFQVYPYTSMVDGNIKKLPMLMLIRVQTIHLRLILVME